MCLARFFAIPFAVRLAWFFWIVLLGAVTFRVLLSNPHSQTVVPIYQTAAERWQRGEDLYAPALPLDVYRNPPGFAAAFTVFDWLPERVAAAVWRILSAAVLLVGLRQLAKATGLSRTQSGWLFALTAVLTVPSVNNGQINVLLAGCMLLGFANALKNEWNQSAFWFALAVGLKLYPLAAALLASLVVPRLAPRILAATLIVLAIPFLMQSPAYVFNEYHSLFEALQHDDRTHSTYLFRVPYDWTVLPRVWLGIVIEKPESLAVSCVAGMLAAWCVWKSNSDSQLATAFVLASIWMALFGPATEIPTYTLLAPAATWRIVMRPTLRTILAVGLLTLPILRGAFPALETLPLRTAAPLGAMILLADVIVEALRRKSRETRGVVTVRIQRSGRDLNPRYGFAVYGISSAASSTTRAPLRDHSS